MESHPYLVRLDQKRFRYSDVDAAIVIVCFIVGQVPFITCRM